MPLPDTEPQNLKYMNYIALTNQLLIIHDILHDFSPSSNKARLSKSTNLIKQTIVSAQQGLSVTTNQSSVKSEKKIEKEKSELKNTKELDKKIIH